MSAYHSVHIRPTAPGADLLADIGALVGEAPWPRTDGGEGFVVGFEGAWLDIILEHDLVDDHEMLFSRYPYYAEVRKSGTEDDGTREVARDLHRLLVGTGRWECFIVWNLAVPVDPSPAPQA